MSAAAWGPKGLAFLLLSFRGRISRSRWWLGCVITTVGNLSGALLFNPDYFVSEEPPPAYWPDTLWQLAWLVPATAVTVKRFNDRDWPWWFGYVFAGINAFYYLAPHLGIVVGPGITGGGLIAFWIIVLVLLAIFIDNGFFRGTDGPNRYGPDPLARDAQSP